ncbi:hypothetical protein EVAR_69949_1 [Eumeta japonica]|uniref:Uncharacterized protein n=1 Tax=Eumeta variegata TaxID=151549 RepID=A0A4C1T7V9_EUMVA|nr:hypothetical protein EVAR_69949_1 [Eumeta japonica]
MNETDSTPTSTLNASASASTPVNTTTKQVNSDAKNKQPQEPNLLPPLRGKGSTQKRSTRPVPPLPAVWSRELKLPCAAALCKPTCDNCGQEHTANYGGCPKAPKARANSLKPSTTGLSLRPCLVPIRGLESSFLELNRSCHERQTAGVHPGRLLHIKFLTKLVLLQTTSKRSFLSTIKRSEISESNRDLRSCRNGQEKLYDLVKYYHLVVRMESILEKVSTTFEEVDTALNNIPDVIETTDEIDSSSHHQPHQNGSQRCSRVVLVSIDRQKLPADALNC